MYTSLFWLGIVEAITFTVIQTNAAPSPPPDNSLMLLLTLLLICGQAILGGINCIKMIFP